MKELSFKEREAESLYEKAISFWDILKQELETCYRFLLARKERN